MALKTYFRLATVVSICLVAFAATGDEIAPNAKQAMTAPSSINVDVGKMIVDCFCATLGQNGRTLQPQGHLLWAISPPEEVYPLSNTLSKEGGGVRFVSWIRVRPLDHFPSCAAVCQASKLTALTGCFRVIGRTGANNIGIPANASGLWAFAQYPVYLLNPQRAANDSCLPVPDAPTLTQKGMPSPGAELFKALGANN